MTANHSNAFLLSATIHGVGLGLLVFFSFAIQRQMKEPEKIFELVAGVGDNFAATEAPALGTPGGSAVQMTLPKPTPPKAEPIVAPAEPTPVIEPAPPKPDPIKTAPPPTKQTPTKQPTKAPPKTMARDLQTKLWRAEARGKTAAEKDRAAEAARAKAEQIAKNQVKHIDGEGIATGVIGGSTNNKVGGAGGTALTSTGGTDMERYFSMLKSRLLEAIDKPHGLSDTLVAEAEFRLAADGSITSVRIIKHSGSPEFDAAVVAAFSHIEMPKRPDGKTGTLSLEFRTRDAQEH